MRSLHGLHTLCLSSCIRNSNKTHFLLVLVLCCQLSRRYYHANDVGIRKKVGRPKKRKKTNSLAQSECLAYAILYARIFCNRVSMINGVNFSRVDWTYIVGWVQDWGRSTILITHVIYTCIFILKLVWSKFNILRYHFLSFEVPQLAGLRARARAMRLA